MRIARIAQWRDDRNVRARAGRSLFDRLLDAVTPKDVPRTRARTRRTDVARDVFKETPACVEALRGRRWKDALEVTFDAAARGTSRGVPL